MTGFRAAIDWQVPRTSSSIYRNLESRDNALCHYSLKWLQQHRCCQNRQTLWYQFLVCLVCITWTKLISGSRLVKASGAENLRRLHYCIYSPASEVGLMDIVNLSCVNVGIRCIAICNDSCTALLLGVGVKEQKKCNCRTTTYYYRYIVYSMNTRRI